MDLNTKLVIDIVERALAEDVGSGDITSKLTIPPSTQASATITAKSSGVIAGLPVAELCFASVDPTVEFQSLVADGQHVLSGEDIVSIQGPAQSILASERVSLNFLQRMSGIATLTSRLVGLVSGTRARIVDTRKTTPGLRILEKYAVTVGGGFNHRFGLYDGILIKDNHIEAAGGLTSAVKAAKARAPHTLRIVVEAKSLSQVDEALQCGADGILLDNMTVEEMRSSVNTIAGKAVVEASGGVNESTVAAIAETGVDIISVGMLTHSYQSLDLSLNIQVAG